MIPDQTEHFLYHGLVNCHIHWLREDWWSIVDLQKVGMENIVQENIVTLNLTWLESGKPHLKVCRSCIEWKSHSHSTPCASLRVQKRQIWPPDPGREENIQSHLDPTPRLLDVALCESWLGNQVLESWSGAEAFKKSLLTSQRALRRHLCPIPHSGLWLWTKWPDFCKQTALYDSTLLSTY